MGYSNSPLVIFQLYYSNQKIIMLSKFVTILAMASTISASPLSKVAENTKAASPYVNIGCQCSPLTFLDQYVTTQGNCLSADSTGARWCYVDSAHTSSCQDLRFSARFPNNPWSYEACATPPPVYAAPQAPLASFTAPHPHPHPAPVPSYPVQSGALPQEQVTMVDSIATLVLLILELSSHMVNIFQSLPTVPQEAVPTP